MDTLINEIEVNWEKLSVTHDKKNELILILKTETDQIELLKDFLTKISKDDVWYSIHWWSPRTFVYPDNIEWILVSHRPEANYFIYSANIDRQDLSYGEKFMKSIREEVQKHFWITHDDIENFWVIHDNAFMYLWIQNNLPQKTSGFSFDISLNLFK